MKDLNYGFMVGTKQHLYTDSNNPVVSTEGFVVQVKKPIFAIKKEILQ